MPPRGNPYALMKAVRVNPNMSASAKRKALSTLRKQVAVARPKGRKVTIRRVAYRPKPRPQNLGVKGFRQVAEGTASLAFDPVRKALDIYRIGSGVNNIRKWLKGRSR